MTDSQMIALFWDRNEDAIRETDRAYGRKLFVLSDKILHSHQDAEESVSDTYMKTWETIPPQKNSVNPKLKTDMKSMVEPSPSGVSHSWCETKSWANAFSLSPLTKDLFCCLASLANILTLRLPDCLVFPMQRFPTEKKMHSGGCG